MALLKIIVVGCSKPHGIKDMITEILRVIPAKIGSIIHKEKNRGIIGVPTQATALSLKEIKKTAKQLLPNANFQIGLYYRYLMLWKKQ